ncbi:MAG TPA: hypothetical protein VFU47_12920 [Armatimonadota bacterium]|nr:hypothetical protein [Armatimonadota bacterium]
MTVTNLAAGPGQLYVADFGATEPSDVSTPLDAGWRNVGGTLDGITLRLTQEWFALQVDQSAYEAGRVRTSGGVQIQTNLAEVTLQNLAAAFSLPDDAVTTAAGMETLEPDDGDVLTPPAYRAVLLEAVGVAGKPLRAIVRRALATDNVEQAYTKSGQRVIPVTFTGHLVSSSIRPFRIMQGV